MDGEHILREANDGEAEPSIKTGIAAPMKEFSNPLFCAPKAGALPGCATPRLTQSILQQLTHLCKGFRPMADPVLLFA